MIIIINWQTYWYATVVLLSIYYLVVFVQFFPDKLQTLFKGRNFPLFKSTSPAFGSNSESSPKPNASATGEDDLFAVTEKLISELQAVLHSAAQKKLNKAELLQQLANNMANKDFLRGTAFEVAVNNYINVEAQINCSINLSEEDLKGLWFGH